MPSGLSAMPFRSGSEARFGRRSAGGVVTPHQPIIEEGGKLDVPGRRASCLVRPGSNSSGSDGGSAEVEVWPRSSRDGDWGRAVSRSGRSGGPCNTPGVYHQLSNGFELKHDGLRGAKDAKFKPMEMSRNLNLEMAPLLYI